MTNGRLLIVRHQNGSVEALSVERISRIVSQPSKSGGLLSTGTPASLALELVDEPEPRTFTGPIATQAAEALGLAKAGPQVEVK